MKVELVGEVNFNQSLTNVMNEQVFIPTESKFREILKEQVDEILARRIPEMIRRSNRKEYITTKEFRELTGCSHRAQQYYRNEGKIPLVKRVEKYGIRQRTWRSSCNPGA